MLKIQTFKDVETMRSTKFIQNILAFAIVAIGFVSIFSLSGFIENRRPQLPEGFENEDLSLQGAKLKGYTLGFDGLIADWYWMKSLQYIGDKLVKTEGDINLDNLKPLNPRLLYPYLDNATSLDPQFLAVYSYGAIVLPAIDPQQAIKIAEKGIANNPNQWRLYQHLGFIYWRLGDYKKASETYENAAKIPNAPPFLSMMSAKMKNDAGSRNTAREIYQQMFDESQDVQTKETAALRLLELDSLDERDAIRLSLQNFHEKNGHCANSWQEVFTILKDVKISSGKRLRFDNNNSPIDPTNVPYLLNSNDSKCDVIVNFKVSKIPPTL